MNYALDTNIIIHYLNSHPSVYSMLRNAIAHGCELVIPKMVDIELRRGFRINQSIKKEASYKILTEDCPVTEMCDRSWEKAIQIYADLYHKRFTVGEMDMLIAAFCLEHDYTLITNNTADFKNIDGLVLEDWTQ